MSVHSKYSNFISYSGAIWRARNADRHCDVGVLMLHYQVESIHQVTPLQIVKCMNSDIIGMFTIHWP